MKKIWLLVALFCAFNLRSAEKTEIEIGKWADSSKVIPVSMSGISGVHEDVVRFDLEVAGFEFVSPDRAQFHISGSSAGKLVGVLSDKSRTTQLLSRNYSGGTERAQAHTFANDIISTLTGNPGITQTKILFRKEVGQNSELFVSDYDGFNQMQITRDQTLVTTPAWAPRALRLYYTSYKSGYPDILVHDLSSGQRQVFSREPGSNFSPAVSPDGKRVAMVLTKGGSPDIYVKNADGTGLKQLTRTREDESSPCWSPDGKLICYVSRYGGRPALYVISPEGGDARRIPTVGVLNITEPDWSPDGKTIVFTSQMGGFNICTVSATGGEARILVAGEDPSWAPNSRTVVFTRRKNNNRVLSLLDVPTKRVKDVRQISGSCSQPAWERTGGIASNAP